MGDHPTPDPLRAALEWYADQFCELGSSHECCGRMSDDECSGCRARAALAAAPQPATPGQRMIRSALTRPSAPETVCHAQEGIGRMECHKCRKSWALDDPRLPPCREDEA